MNKAHVTKTALVMVKKSGLINLSQRDLCQKSGIPDGSWFHIMECKFSEFVDGLQLNGYGAIPQTVNKIRANPTLRRNQILNVALDLAKEIGYNKMTRDGIAERAGISMGLVTKYFKTMTQLRRAVIRAAIACEIPEIIAQGLANKDDHALKAPDKLKAKAIKLIANY